MPHISNKQELTQITSKIKHVNHGNKCQTSFTVWVISGALYKQGSNGNWAIVSQKNKRKGMC